MDHFQSNIMILGFQTVNLVIYQLSLKGWGTFLWAGSSVQLGPVNFRDKQVLVYLSSFGIWANKIIYLALMPNAPKQTIDSDGLFTPSKRESEHDIAFA